MCRAWKSLLRHWVIFAMNWFWSAAARPAMSPPAYSEDLLVEQPAIGLFAMLDWQTASALEETFGAGGTLARRLRREPHPLKAADSGTVLEQRAAHRQQRHRQPRRLDHR
jgi:hypothetical protein